MNTSVREKIVKLNVGGVKYVTTTTTLSKFGGFLASLCKYDGQNIDELPVIGGALRDEKNRIFIDRDGKIFKYILEFLRSGEFSCSPKLINKLRIEAEFFQITQLSEELETPMYSIGQNGSNDLVILNVGGVKFTTTLQTLQGKEVMPEGYLRKIAESIINGSELCRDLEGNIFIDRDPEIFKCILSYIRNSVLPDVSPACAKYLAVDLPFYLGTSHPINSFSSNTFMGIKAAAKYGTLIGS